jgi:asparagine synthase (glutamine-hydrolysing)
MKLFETKRLVKNVAQDFLPNEIIYRKKAGFGVPLVRWMKTSDRVQTIVEEICCTNYSQEYLNITKIKELYDQHRSGIRDYSEILWTIINFYLWRKAFSA